MSGCLLRSVLLVDGDLPGPDRGRPPAGRRLAARGMHSRHRPSRSSPRLRASWLVTPLLLAGCAGVPAAFPDEGPAALQAELEALVEGFDGTVGIYARRPGTGEEVALRADETFPTASLVKVPILLALYEQIEAGTLDPHQKLEYSATRSRGGEDLLAAFESGSTLTLSKLVHLMAAFSDNTASLWCQELAGGGQGVNAWLAAHGFDGTRVNARTAGREQPYREWGWGQTTPREMAQLLATIRAGRAVSPRADEEMYRVLCRTYWDAEALSQLPPWVQAASKQGAVSRSRSEVVLVNALAGDYVFCVITKEQADPSWGADNAGFVLLRDVSRLLWERWGGGDPWAPAPDVEAWR